MKRISVYVRNQDEGASCYYRIIQYTKEINANFKINNAMSKKNYRHNLDLTNNWSKKLLQVYFYILMLIRLTWFIVVDIIKTPDFVIVQRTTIPRYTPKYYNALLSILAKRTDLYWDFDDDIFINGEISYKQAEILFKYSAKIIVTNNYLHERVPEKFRNKVIKLPTTDGDFRNIDLNDILKNRKQSFQNEIRLVWVATSSNIPNLLKIIPELDLCAQELYDNYKKKLVLSVVCNKPVENKTQKLIIDNINWTRETARKVIIDSHIGLMPLQYSKYALGKGGFKLIQYLATGLPVIGSNVGFNNDVISEDCGILVDDRLSSKGWNTAIKKIVIDWDHWKTYSDAAYNRWKQVFSYENNLLIWKNLLLDEPEHLNYKK